MRVSLVEDGELLDQRSPRLSAEASPPIDDELPSLEPPEFANWPEPPDIQLQRESLTTELLAMPDVDPPDVSPPSEERDQFVGRDPAAPSPLKPTAAWSSSAVDVSQASSDSAQAVSNTELDRADTEQAQLEPQVIADVQPESGVADFDAWSFPSPAVSKATDCACPMITMIVSFA